MMSISLRPIKTKDHDAWISMVECYHENLCASAINKTWEKFFYRKEDIGKVYGLIALHECNVIGFMHFTISEMPLWQGPLVYVADIFVLEEFRRLGAARKMLEFAIDFGKKIDAKYVWWLTASNNPARLLYDQYAISEEVGMYTFINEDAQ